MTTKLETKGKITVTIGDDRYEVKVNEVCPTEMYKTGRTTSRVYMSTKKSEHPELDAAIHAAAKDVGSFNEDGSVKIYTRRGDYPTVDKAFDSLNRALVKEYKVIVDKVFDALAVNPTSVHYSKTAGCACECSPGFVVKGHFASPVDMWITEVAA